jgi:hypothetical protein
MGRHSRRGARRRRTQALAIVAATGSEGTGIFLVSWGNHLAAQNYYYSVLPWGFWGAFFIALPVIALAIVVVAAIAHVAAGEHRQYRAWKASLPPEERMAVELAEAAALTAAAIAWHEHNKRVDARLTSSVMGYTMPDGHTMRPSDRIASYQQRAALRHPAPQQVWGAPDPTAASQTVIARSHPEHLDTTTGEYRILSW